MKINRNVTTTKISKGINTMKYIILHHTASAPSASDDTIVKYLAFNKREVSCHYIVGKDGQVYQIADDNKITWHAGISNWKGETNINISGIGIEIVSDGTEFTKAQKDAVRELVIKLMIDHNINASEVLRHADIAPLRKRDVGPNFYAPLTWSQYQDTYRPVIKSEPDYNLSVKDVELLQKILMMNSEAWNNTDNQHVKYTMHEHNKKIRDKFGLV